MKHSIAAARTPHAAAALRTGMALDMLVAWPTTKSPRLDHRSREGQGCEEENSVPQGTTEQRHSLNRRSAVGARSPLLGANANSADSFDIVFKPGVLDERLTPYTMATFQDRVREIVSRSVATAISSIASDLPARILADPINHDERDCGAVWIDDSLRSSGNLKRDGAAVLASSVGEKRGPGGMTVESDANALRGIAKTLVSIRNARNEPMDSDAAQMSRPKPLWPRKCPQRRDTPCLGVRSGSARRVRRGVKTMSSKDCRLPQVPAVCAPERIPSAAATVDKKEDTKKAVKAIAKRKARGCGRCDGCIREDCGKCAACIDKTKFGGANRKKKRCVHRVCTAMTYNNPNNKQAGHAEKKGLKEIEKNAASEKGKTSGAKGCLSPWTEEVIEEIVRLRREKFNNKNSWTEIAALISKPGGFRWQGIHLANLWHLGNSQVERFTCDGRITPIKYCVNADGHWKPEYQRRKSNYTSAPKPMPKATSKVEDKCPPKPYEINQASKPPKGSRVIRCKCPFPGCQKDGNSIEWYYAEEEPAPEEHATVDGDVRLGAENARLMPTAEQERGNFDIWLSRRKAEWRARRKVGSEPGPEPPRANDSPPHSVASSPKPATLLSAAVSTSHLRIITPPTDDSVVDRAVDVETFV
ncbi:hypothetical protein THAOC_15041 [Thalassiosira oceanica]|uniref:CXXC-type domain-containing protein n=1 Tax=Thalassiosira oceanica TaxID=159749 RepID=K0SH05_THAOC|nr:hypothetical protein THAOC_15041 [Thalassiosira oceanica]|eukprot:EJK64244.1 hypothetical protein THAOC_15041 [Thalassiosira oceanica]